MNPDDSRLVRLAVAAALAPFGVALAGGPALAHPPPQQVPDAAYYRTQLAGVAPAVPGVTAGVDPGGEWVSLSNAGPATVIVLGYTGEPYLRVTAAGVEENELSQTTYINRALFADSVPSGTDGGTVAPSWKQIATTGAARWHDHRIHWMGQARPPAVAADPAHPHPVGTWTVHATADGVPFDVHGTLRWLGVPRAGGSQLSVWLIAVLCALPLGACILGWQVVQRRRAAASVRTDAAPDGPTDGPEPVDPFLAVPGP